LNIILNNIKQKINKVKDNNKKIFTLLKWCGILGNKEGNE